jgi:hypothetical protein
MDYALASSYTRMTDERDGLQAKGRIFVLRSSNPFAKRDSALASRYDLFYPADHGINTL